ncbi:hypothetical protein GCM10027589_22250 [Actinocorallia lasiicapitis]
MKRLVVSLSIAVAFAAGCGDHQYGQAPTVEQTAVAVAAKPKKVPKFCKSLAKPPAGLRGAVGSGTRRGASASDKRVLKAAAKQLRTVARDKAAPAVVGRSATWLDRLVSGRFKDSDVKKIASTFSDLGKAVNRKCSGRK